LKDWQCVEVKHNKDIGKTIKEWEKNGCIYSTAGSAGPMTSIINHYLLFEREI
jgi:hypothetical protein